MLACIRPCAIAHDLPSTYEVYHSHCFPIDVASGCGSNAIWFSLIADQVLVMLMARQNQLRMITTSASYIKAVGQRKCKGLRTFVQPSLTSGLAATGYNHLVVAKINLTCLGSMTFLPK